MARYAIYIDVLIIVCIRLNNDSKWLKTIGTTGPTTINVPVSGVCKILLHRSALAFSETFCSESCRPRSSYTYCAYLVLL